MFAKALARAQHRKAQGPSTAEPQASRFLPGLRASLDVSSPAERHGQEAPSKVHTCLRLKLAKSAEVGQDLSLVLLAENLAFEHKDLKLSISTGSVLHDGTPLPPFWQNTLYIPFRPKEGISILAGLWGPVGWRGPCAGGSDEAGVCSSPFCEGLFHLQRRSSHGQSPTPSMGDTCPKTGWCE